MHVFSECPPRALTRREGIAEDPELAANCAVRDGRKALRERLPELNFNARRERGHTRRTRQFRHGKAQQGCENRREWNAGRSGPGVVMVSGTGFGEVPDNSPRRRGPRFVAWPRAITRLEGPLIAQNRPRR